MTNGVHILFYDPPCFNTNGIAMKSNCNSCKSKDEICKNTILLHRPIHTLPSYKRGVDLLLKMQR